MTFQKQLGMEQSSQLTNSIIFQRARWLNHQALHHFHHVSIPWWDDDPHLLMSPGALRGRRRDGRQPPDGAWPGVAPGTAMRVQPDPGPPKPLVGADDRAEAGEMVRNHVGPWMAPDFDGISAGGYVFCGFYGNFSKDNCFLFKRPSNFNDCLHALNSSMEMSPGPIFWVTS